jgi:hypothetical protein
MIPLFVGLTLVNLLTFAVAGAIGYMGTRGGQDVRGWHILAGALAGIVACGVHCFVFTYFVATAKWIQHAVLVKHLDPALLAPTRSFKAQAFPAAMIAIAVSLVAVFSGAARDTQMISRTAHHAITIGAFVINILVAAVEYRAIARNGRLIDEVLAKIARSSTPADVS